MRDEHGSYLAGVLVSFLLPAGVLDELLPGGELGLAAGLQPDGVDPPVLQVLTVVQHADLLHDVKTTCPVEVDDAAKYARVPGEYYWSQPGQETLTDLSKKNWLSCRL